LTLASRGQAVDRLRGMLRTSVRSPSRLAAAVIAALLVLNLPGTIDLATHASQAELAILVVVAPVTFGLGIFFVWRLWRRPTRMVIFIFLVVWVAPTVTTILGGGLQPGAFVPLVLDILAAVLAAFALGEARTVAFSQSGKA
jgi:hypothetical protein